MGVFTATEVCDLGIEKEKKRRDFYGLAAERFTDEELRDLFTRLRNWEEQHIEKFRQIRANTEGLELVESYPGELEAYMQALVDEKLYRHVTPAQFGEFVKTPLDAIWYGIDFEKDAILFFQEVLPYADSPSKDVIQKLIDEEKQHIVYLVRLKKKYEG